MTQPKLFESSTIQTTALSKDDLRRVLDVFLASEGEPIATAIRMAVERYEDVIYLSDVWEIWSQTLTAVSGIGGQFEDCTYSAGRSGDKVTTYRTAFLDDKGELRWVEIGETILPPSPVFGIIRGSERRSASGNELCLMVLEALR